MKIWVWPRTRRSALVWLLLTFLGVLQAGQGAVTDPSVTEVTVDTNSTLVKSFMGLGIQWDPYEYPPRPEAWKLTLHRLDFAKPAFFRVMVGAASYCKGFDGAGNPQYFWTDGEETIQQKMGSLLDILDYAQSKKIDVMLGEWGPPHRLGDGSKDEISSPDDPHWAEIVTDFVSWLRNSRGYSVVRYYNLMNEPNGRWMWPKGKVDYNAWAAGVRGLRKQFDTHDLSDLPIVGPDNSANWEWVDKVSQEMPETIGGWEMHWYASNRDIWDGNIEHLLSAKKKVILTNDIHSSEKRFFLGESGLIDGKRNGDQQPRVKTFLYGVMMADYVAQVAQAGWMGMSAWDMDDAMHSVHEHPTVPGDTTLKVWGFWNTQGTAMGHPEDENIRPWFYTWSLMSRLFPRDTRIVGVSESNVPDLRIMAGQSPDQKHLNIMLVNDSDDSRKVKLIVPGMVSQTVTLFHYFEADCPVDGEGFAQPAASLTNTDLAAGFEVALPSRGVVFVLVEADQGAAASSGASTSASPLQAGQMRGGTTSISENKNHTTTTALPETPTGSAPATTTNSPAPGLVACTIIKTVPIEAYGPDGQLTSVSQSVVGRSYQFLRIENGKAVLHDQSDHIFKIRADAVNHPYKKG